jgi:hypothetical protein
VVQPHDRHYRQGDTEPHGQSGQGGQVGRGERRSVAPDGREVGKGEDKSESRGGVYL